MDRWRGKTAVVTGANGGIGGAIAERLGAEGLVVVGVDLTTADEVTTGKKILLKRDVTDLAQLASTFREIDERYGGVDVLINCVGYAKLGHITSVGTNKISDADIAKTMDVNINSMIFCTRHAVDSMKRRGVNGHIVNINSIAGHYVAFSDNFNVYSSSKYAVTAFTQSFIQEMTTFKSKIKATSVSPGLVQTQMGSAVMGDRRDLIALQPADIADAVIYALSTPPHVNISELTIQPVGELRK